MAWWDLGFWRLCGEWLQLPKCTCGTGRKGCLPEVKAVGKSWSP